MAIIISEEKIQLLRTSGIRVPEVNQDCIGCSACVAISPEVFELNDEGKSEVTEQENYDNLDIDDAIMACPVDAISWGKE